MGIGFVPPKCKARSLTIKPGLYFGLLSSLLAVCYNKNLMLPIGCSKAALNCINVYYANLIFPHYRSGQFTKLRRYNIIIIFNPKVLGMPNFFVNRIQLPELDLTTRSVLRVSIDKYWEARGFAQLFQNIDFLYANKFWTYRAIVSANDFFKTCEKSPVQYLHFEHTLAHAAVDAARENLRNLERDDFRPHFVPMGERSSISRL
jgi:hypothetical protein